MSSRERVCDAHFHLWNVREFANANLGDIVVDGVPGAVPVYEPPSYLADMAPVDLTGVVHVETVVGQSAGGPVIDTVEETRRVCAYAATFPVPVRIVPYVHLGRPDAEDVIKAHLAHPGVVGVRMIQNFDPTDPRYTWPQVDRYYVGDAQFRKNFSLLERYNLSFDLHINPEQAPAAAEFLRDFPRVPVVVDHMLCARPGCFDDAAWAAVWRAGIAALAALPNVHIKVSSPVYSYRALVSGDDAAVAAARAGAAALVAEVVAAFGPRRCMFASNHPVDKFIARAGGALTTLATLATLPAGLTAAERADVLEGNAKRFYRF